MTYRSININYNLLNLCHLVLFFFFFLCSFSFQIQFETRNRIHSNSIHLFICLRNASGHLPTSVSPTFRSLSYPYNQFYLCLVSNRGNFRHCNFYFAVITKKKTWKNTEIEQKMKSDSFIMVLQWKRNGNNRENMRKSWKKKHNIFKELNISN